MAGDNEVTVGEVYRTLVNHEAKLDAILKQTTATNGRVISLERKTEQHDVALLDLKRSAHSPQTDTPKDAITINVPMNGKTIAALILALVAIVAAWWKALA